MCGYETETELYKVRVYEMVGLNDSVGMCTAQVAWSRRSKYCRPDVHCDCPGFGAR